MDDDIERLRVMQAELSTGNTSGQVFMRLSQGSAFLLTERPIVKEKIKAALLTTNVGQKTASQK